VTWEKECGRPYGPARVAPLGRQGEGTDKKRASRLKKKASWADVRPMESAREIRYQRRGLAGGKALSRKGEGARNAAGFEEERRPASFVGRRALAVGIERNGKGLLVAKSPHAGNGSLNRRRPPIRKGVSVS